MGKRINSTTDVIEQVADAAEGNGRITVGEVLDSVGRRSFGPFVAFVGLVLAVPGVSDIPSVPTLLGTLIILVVGQQIVGRQKIWLPSWLLDRSVEKSKLRTVLDWAEKGTKRVDRLFTQRLVFLVESRFAWLVTAFACISIALIMPVLELIPFSANLAGVALLMFGISYIVQDGLVVALSFLVYFATLTTGWLFL